MKKVYALVDCNSFYCSCERIFRPDLWNRPVIVLSNNDGCAIARTTEAKALGIKMGDPYFKIKSLCQKNKVAVFSSNFSLYTNISDRVMNTLKKLCPQLDVYSIDEAFCDLTGIKDYTTHGKLLKETIYQNIGIPVGVGIGPTKVLAKIANRIAKNSKKANGVVSLMDEKFQDIALKMTPVSDIWGVGQASAQKLAQLGIKTAYEFKIFDNEKLIQKIFTKIGLQIKHELMGINCFPLSMEIEKKKEIMCSRTFGATVNDLENLKQSVANYICNAAEKMRRQNSVCTELSVFANTNLFNHSEQFYLYEKIKLQNPTCDSRKLIKSAFDLLDKNFQAGYEYKKAGITLSNFFDSNQFQIDFFSPSDSVRDLRLMQVIDRINYLEGEGTIKIAACGTNDEAWAMNRRFKSPRFTTSWNELPIF